MIVHRVGRTILLDEFDVHSHLLRLEKVKLKEIELIRFSCCFFLKE